MRPDGESTEGNHQEQPEQTDEILLSVRSFSVSYARVAKYIVRGGDFDKPMNKVPEINEDLFCRKIGI